MRKISWADFVNWWHLTPRERLVRRLAKAKEQDIFKRRRTSFDVYIANTSRRY